jgi:hypothetical protein
MPINLCANIRLKLLDAGLLNNKIFRDTYTIFRSLVISSKKSDLQNIFIFKLTLLSFKKSQKETVKIS